MNGATRPLAICFAAVLCFTGAAQDTPAPNPAAAAAAEARMRAAMASLLRGQSSWETGGADAQRSSWVRTDPKISKEGVQKPEFRFLWKLNLAEKSAHANSLSPAILLNHYIGYRGFRDLAFIANEGVGAYGVDIDLGRIEWEVHDAQAQPRSCSAGTPNGVARPLTPAFPNPAPRFGSGRGGPARSAVGEPYEGAVTLAETDRNGTRSPGGTAAAAAAGPRSDASAPRPLAPARPIVRPPRPPAFVYVLTADGMLHSMFVSNGHQPKPAVPFLPPNSAARGFILVNETAYAAAIACGGGASSVIALDTNSGAATSWKAPGEIAGQQGLAFGPDGTVFVGTVGGDLFALDPTTLEVKDRLEAGESFVSSPVIFQYRQQALGAVATRSGLVLFDTKSLGGPDHRTPLFKTKSGEGQSFDSTSLASWMDNGARRWIVLPGKTSGIGAIEAWQVKEDQNHTLSLALGWTSHEIPSPSPAMIVNGVVFAASNADAPEAGSRRRSPSVIYALDGISGKELWNSGKAITSSAHTGSLSGGASQIYLGADDGTLYAFGAWIEREDAP